MSSSCCQSSALPNKLRWKMYLIHEFARIKHSRKKMMRFENGATQQPKKKTEDEKPNKFKNWTMPTAIATKSDFRLNQNKMQTERLKEKERGREGKGEQWVLATKIAIEIHWQQICKQIKRQHTYESQLTNTIPENEIKRNTGRWKKN